jgi:hypothetical protein
VLAVKTDEEPAKRELPDLVSAAPARAEMESVTDVHGTVARFEMAYSPTSRGPEKFGPPLRQRVGSMVFFAFGVTIATLVAIAYYASSSNSALYMWVVEGDRARPLPAPVLAFFVFVSGLGTLVRARMRGVVVHVDGIEARYLLPLGVPRVKRWAWAQIERVVIDDESAMLELWDSTYERLPDVARPRELGALLERIAGSRRIVVTRLDAVDR